MLHGTLVVSLGTTRRSSWHAYAHAMCCIRRDICRFAVTLKVESTASSATVSAAQGMDFLRARLRLVDKSSGQVVGATVPTNSALVSFVTGLFLLPPSSPRFPSHFGLVSLRVLFLAVQAWLS